MGKFLLSGESRSIGCRGPISRVLGDGPVGTVPFLLKMGRHLHGWEWPSLAVFLCYQHKMQDSDHIKAQFWLGQKASLPLSVQSS